MPSTAGWGDPTPSGLIDQLVSFRTLPGRSPYLFLPEDNERRLAYVDGIDQCLDVIVDAFQGLLTLQETTEHGRGCLSRAQIEKIIGRVPRG